MLNRGELYKLSWKVRELSDCGTLFLWLILNFYYPPSKHNSKNSCGPTSLTTLIQTYLALIIFSVHVLNARNCIDPRYSHHLNNNWIYYYLFFIILESSSSDWFSINTTITQLFITYLCQYMLLHHVGVEKSMIILIVIIIFIVMDNGNGPPACISISVNKDRKLLSHLEWPNTQIFT